MKYRKTKPNQLTARKERCIRCMKETLFTCTQIEGLEGKTLCPKCETDLEAVAKKHTTPPHRRCANKPTLKRTKTRNRRGSNQYQVKKRTDWLLILITLILGGLLYMMAHAMLTSRLDDTFLNWKAEAVEIISPLPETDVPASAIPEATPTPSVTAEQPEGEEADLVREIFGSHADKAFQVLACENSTLNPKAVNTAGNTPAGSRDIGVFQINEYWQGVHSKFLFDARTNITMAWQIYRDSGYSFRMWSCGKRLGI